MPTFFAVVALVLSAAARAQPSSLFHDKPVLGPTLSISDPVSLTFHRDGKHLVVGAKHEWALVWNIETSDVKKIESELSTAFATLTPDGKAILTGGPSSAIWDAQTGRKTRTITQPWDEGEAFFALSPDGESMLTAGKGHEARIRDYKRGVVLHELGGFFSGHDQKICAAIFSPNGRHVATSGWDAKLILWDARTGDEIHKFKTGGVIKLCSIAFSADGSLFAAGDGNGRVFIWEVASNRIIREFQAPVPPNLPMNIAINSLAFSPDGSSIAAASAKLILWDLATGAELMSIPPIVLRVRAVAFSPDGNSIALADGNHGVQLWRLRASRDDARKLLQPALPVRPGDLDLPTAEETFKLFNWHGAVPR